jgi:hypothetical protein
MVGLVAALRLPTFSDVDARQEAGHDQSEFAAVE